MTRQKHKIFNLMQMLHLKPCILHIQFESRIQYNIEN